MREPDSDEVVIDNLGTIRAGDGRRMLIDASEIRQVDDPNNPVYTKECWRLDGEYIDPMLYSKIQINGARVVGGIARTIGDNAAIELLGDAVLDGVDH